MKRISGWVLGTIFLFLSYAGNAQADLFVNMALLDGLGITPDNLLNYQIQSNLTKATRVQVLGSIRYRNSTLSVSYKFDYTLQPGVNNISTSGISPAIVYSDPALKSLFEQYKMLPEGIYEYCVSVSAGAESKDNLDQQCIYHKSEDIFLINLIDPENDAKIYEHNPMLSWVVNYPFASELKYRLRVAEIKKGQNQTIAINRNAPVYDERNLMQLSQIYPLYAKPLVVNQPYAWTVDAYYRGILIGGAETWKFTIVEDSLLAGIPKNPSYIDLSKETGFYNLYAPGILKIKYDLKDLKTDSLQLTLLDNNGDSIKLKDQSVLNAQYGDNRFVINFAETQPLKHLKTYTMLFSSQTGRVYRVAFTYANPDFIK